MHGTESTTMPPPEFFPDPPAPFAAPVATLPYAGLLPVERVGQSGFGVASLVVCGLTLGYTVVCAVGMSQAKDWDAMVWLFFGFAGNWAGCGLGILLGFVGIVQSRRRRRLSAHAMWLNAAVAVL